MLGLWLWLGGGKGLTPDPSFSLRASGVSYSSGLSRRRGLLGFGFGREEVVVVVVDGIADGFAPVVGIEGVDVFVLGDVDGLQEGLGQVGDGAGSSGFYIAADYGGDEA